MNKKLAKLIMMGLICANTLPVNAMENIITNKNFDLTEVTSNTNGEVSLPIGSNENQHGGDIDIFFSPKNISTTIYAYGSYALSNIHNGNVKIGGNDLSIRDKGTDFWVHDTSMYSAGSGNMIFNNAVDIESINHAAIRTDAKLVFNNFLNVNQYATSVPQYEPYTLRIDTNGEVYINSSLVLSSYYIDSSGGTKNGAVIRNDGKLVINNNVNPDTTVIDGEMDGIVVINGDITHNNGYTDITLKGDKQVWRGNVHSSDENFHLKLEDGGTWHVYHRGNDEDNQGTISYGVHIDNVEMNNGRIFTFSDYENDVWNNVYIYNFKSDGIFDASNGFFIRTDLTNNDGDSLEFRESTPNVVVPVYIIDRLSDGTRPWRLIEPDEGKSVSIVTAPVDSKLKINAWATYLGDGNVYNTVIEEDIDTRNNLKVWNFVGWEAGEDVRPEDKAKQEQVDHSILVEDVEPIFKRFNDLRTDPSEIGVWVRGETGETKIRNLSYDHNIMSGGYDWDYKNDAGVLFAGVGFTYSTNKCDDKAIGDTKGYGFNAYGSWLGKKNNDYVDLVVKYGKIDKSYAGYDENNIFVAGDYDKDLFTIAAKYGRRIFKDDWYYEPSVGLTWGRVGSADFTDNHGTRIHADNSYSNIASLGIQVGKNIKGIEYYGKAEVMHDFDGKIHVSAPGRSVEDDMGGTWVKCAIGASRKIDENNSFYLEVERDFGNKVEKPYGFSVGYRFTW